MTPLMNALACLLALGCASFLWKERSSLYRNGILLAVFLQLFCMFAYAGFDVDAVGGKMGAIECYPFRLMALCLCFSTTSLKQYRRRYLVLAQMLWFWMELFGGIALYYRGMDMVWTRIIALSGMAFCSTFLSRISKEMEFCLMVFWIAIWIFF